MWCPVKLLHISYNLFAGTEMLSLSVYEPIALQILHGEGTVPNLGEGSSYGVECGTRWNSSILGTICLLVSKCHLSPFMSQSQCKFCLVGPSPNLGERVELGGRLWCNLKVLYIMHNLFAGTEMLSLTVYEPISIKILVGGRPPIFGGGLS